jgi:hypothetical protein
MTSGTMTKATIEELWSILRTTAPGAQRRIDSTHPLDIYADFEQPDRPGIVVFCSTRPPDSAPLKSIGVERRQRQDGRWSLHIVLEEPQLLPVFAELCRDIILFTRSGVDPSRPGGPILTRIERWRNLMQAETTGLSRTQLRGLIGELLVLEKRVLPALGPDEAVSSWTGPLGTPHDFQLASGLKLEVKAVSYDADRVLINGLGQLDGGGDPLELGVVRIENTGRDAAGAVTASRQVSLVRALLAETPSALQSFNTLLRFVGWDDTDDTGAVCVRLARIDWHKVTSAFPRLTVATAPPGVVDASYVIVLPPTEAEI